MPPPPLQDHSSPVGHLVTPHKCPHSPPCTIVPADVFPSLLHYSVCDPDAPPHFEDLFPPGYNLFSHIPPQQITPYIPSNLSTHLDPPPSYDSLFVTTASTDSVEAPLHPWGDPSFGILMLIQIGTCSSSPSNPVIYIYCYGLVELKLEVVHLLLNIYYISLQMFDHKLPT